MSKKRNKEALPWVDIILTAEERTILNDEPAELTKLYIALSERRDFSTGIAGIRTKISGQALREVMSLTARRGRAKKNISNGQIFDWLRQLKLCGLIIDKGNYVFELPFAPKHESVSGKYDRSMTAGLTASMTDNKPGSLSINIEENSKKQELEIGSMTAGKTPGSLDVVTPPNDLNKTNVMLLGETNFSQFVSLLGEYKFRHDQILSAKTVEMIREWIADGITIAEAKEAIEAINAKGVPGHPSYYLRPVISARKAKLAAQEEAKDERLRDTGRPRVRKRDSDDENLEKWRKALYDSDKGAI